ncbi:MAG: sulfur carrier protein ThiS [Spirochaetota bacterium]|nr:sulfur carrier protein ThiS [Spirochaetota bacterium]
MILVNDKSFDWFNNMGIFDLLKVMGYTLKKPSVLIKVNKQVIRKSDWDDYIIPKNANITVVNLLRGG